MGQSRCCFASAFVLIIHSAGRGGVGWALGVCVCPVGWCLASVSCSGSLLSMCLFLFLCLLQAGMVKDLVNILNCQERFAPRYELMKLAAITGATTGAISSSSKARLVRLKQQLTGEGEAAMQQLLEGEMQARGDFLPLMPHFPYDKVFSEGYAIAFEDVDYQVQQMGLGEGEQQQKQEQDVQQRVGVRAGQKRQQQEREEEVLFSEELGLSASQKGGSKGVGRSRRRSVKRLRKQQVEQQQQDQAGQQQQQHVPPQAAGGAGGET